MNRTPKVRHKKSNIGVFIMKLRYKAKVQIYELRQQGISLKRLSEKYGINYFHPISEQFEPFITENQVDSKIGITGSIVENSLYYWFDIVDKSVPDVKVVSSNLPSQVRQEYPVPYIIYFNRII